MRGLREALPILYVLVPLAVAVLPLLLFRRLDRRMKVAVAAKTEQETQSLAAAEANQLITQLSAEVKRVTLAAAEAREAADESRATSDDLKAQLRAAEAHVARLERLLARYDDVDQAGT